MTTIYRGGCASVFPGQVESAVDLIHKPTGIRIFCTQERSQLKNRDLAMKLLRSKLYDIELEKQQSETSGNRRAQVNIRLFCFFIQVWIPGVPTGVPLMVRDLIYTCTLFFVRVTLRRSN